MKKLDWDNKSHSIANNTKFAQVGEHETGMAVMPASIPTRGIFLADISFT